MSEAELEIETTIRAWKDPAFKARLLAHPLETLAECGYKVPKGLKIEVVEEKPGVRIKKKPGVRTLVLKAAPAEMTSVNLEDLKKIEASITYGSCHMSTLCGSPKDRCCC